MYLHLGIINIFIGHGAGTVRSRELYISQVISPPTAASSTGPRSTQHAAGGGRSQPHALPAKRSVYKLVVMGALEQSRGGVGLPPCTAVAGRKPV